MTSCFDERIPVMEWKKSDMISTDREQMQNRFENLTPCEPKTETVDDDSPGEVVSEEYFDEETAVPEENNGESDSGESADEEIVVEEDEPSVNEGEDSVPDGGEIPTMTSDEFLKAYNTAEAKAEKLRSVSEIKEELAAYSAMYKTEREEKGGEKPAPNFSGFIQDYNNSRPRCDECSKRHGSRQGK